MTPAELKSAALTLLDGGDAWCKRANAQLASGLPCSPLSAAAVKWDLFGAIRKAYEGETDYTSYHLVLKDFTDGIPPSHYNRDIESWNDVAVWNDIEGILTHTSLKANFGTGERASGELT